MPQTTHPISPPHLDVTPGSLADSAARLRRLALSSPPSAMEHGSFPRVLDDASGIAPAPDSGIGRFLAALSAATRAHEQRLSSLGGYADGAAAALEWVAGEVDDAESSSAARFGRDGAVLA